MRIERNQRVSFRVSVKYGSANPPELNSIATNISEGGIHLQTNKVLKPGTKVYLIIDDGDKSFDCEGVVRWAKKVPPGFERIAPCGMGVKLNSSPREMLELFNRKLSERATTC